MNKRPCKACGKEIVFLLTTKGSMPVNAETVQEDDTHFDRTRHISHFSTCKDADRFRKKKAA